MSGGDAVVSRAKDVLRQYEIATRFNVQVDGRRPHEVIAELVTEVELLQGLYQDAVDLACRYNDELKRLREVS